LTRHRTARDSKRRDRARPFIESLGDETLEMAQIPGGTFTMGAPETEAGSRDNERPPHRVTVPSFYLGKYAVTIAQWTAVIAFPARMLTVDETFKADGRQPVVRVSCDEAEAFCRQLSQATGRNYRLPTEAEWEYACRAGTASPFWFGAAISPRVVNYAAGQDGEDRDTTVPAGTLGRANGFGLFDMHGNVWEWCQDRWHGSYEGAPVDGSAWMSGADQRTRVLRGGSWAHGADSCRAAARTLSGEPTARSRKIGFRVAMTPGAA
jgi:formylglycine-generating enzyme required for sulfatase activity